MGADDSLDTFCSHRKYLAVEIRGHPNPSFIMNELSDLAQKFKCAFLMIRQPSKQIRDFAIHIGAGSYAFAGVVSSMLLIGKDPADPSKSVMVHNKYNLSVQGQSIRFRITEEERFEW
jgi:hypothetical protein